MQTIFQYHAKIARLQKEESDAMAAAKTGQERRDIKLTYKEKARQLHREHDRLNS